MANEKYVNAYEATQEIMKVPPGNWSAARYASVLSTMQAADVAPVRHGKWIEDEYGYIHCSECGSEWDEPEPQWTPFCPMCGAKMDKEVIL